jgi:acetyl-CoA carboxylase biotin carboxyl carrier protein
MPSKLSLDVDLVKKLSKIMKEHDLNEVELEEGDGRLCIRRGGAPMPMPMAAPQAAAMPMAVSASGPEAAPVEAPAVSASPSSSGPGPGEVTSPMVGTAYLSPAPGAKNFIKEGDTVREGQTLLIIEAMKVMNQISSPFSGVVKKIHVDDAQPVEFGEVMVTVIPA